MALSVRIFVKSLDSAVRGSWDQHSQTALLSYPGIKIHPQTSILIWFGLLFCIFMKTITITALGRSPGGFWLIEIRQKEMPLSGNWCLYFALKKKFHKSWIPVKDISETNCKRSRLRSHCKMEAYSGIRVTEMWRNFPVLMNLWFRTKKQKQRNMLKFAWSSFLHINFLGNITISNPKCIS